MPSLFEDIPLDQLEKIGHIAEKLIEAFNGAVALGVGVGDNEEEAKADKPLHTHEMPLLVLLVEVMYAYCYYRTHEANLDAKPSNDELVALVQSAAAEILPNWLEKYSESLDEAHNHLGVIDQLNRRYDTEKKEQA
jgi:hypothetical protein